MHTDFPRAVTGSPKKHWRLGMPAVGALLCYLVVLGIPRYREIQSVESEIAAKRQAVERATLALRQVAMTSDALPGYEDAPAAELDARSAAALTSFAATFARVMAVLESHGIHCVAARPVSAGEESEEAQGTARIVEPRDEVLVATGGTRQRLTLSGEFHQMLAALEELEQTIPSIAAESFQMDRHDESTPCRWDIVLRSLEEER